MKRKMHNQVVVLTSGKRTLTIRCRRFEELPDRYIVVKSEGYGIQGAAIYRKSMWALVSDPPKPTKKRKHPHQEAHETLYDPSPEPTPEPVPEPEPEPVPIPIVPKTEPDEEFSDDDMELINDTNALVAREDPGNLKVELPGEYNNNVPHEMIGSEELMKMKALVDSEFARAEGMRKIAQIKAKRSLMARLETTGVGCIPD